MKRLMALILIICLIFMIMGCSGGTNEKPENGTPAEDPADDPGDSPTEDPAEEPAQLEAFFEIEEIHDLVKNFRELSYTFSDDTTMLTVEYLYIDQDSVGGSDADHFTISFDQDNDGMEMEIWMDSSGSVLKAIFDGQEMDAMQAPMATMFLSVILVPFVMHAGEWEDAFVMSNGYEQLGWVVTDRSRENRSFGAGSTTVHRYSFKIKGVGEVSDLDYQFEVAEISGRSMFVGWQIDMNKEHTSSFKVESVIPR